MSRPDVILECDECGAAVGYNYPPEVQAVIEAAWMVDSVDTWGPIQLTNPLIKLGEALRALKEMDYTYQKAAELRKEHGDEPVNEVGI